MKIEVKKEQHQHLLFFDAEYDREDLKQIAAILFKKEGELYELIGSVNIYINDNQLLSNFFTNFTAISQSFINRYGVSLEKTKEIFYNFIKDCDDILFISHNIQNDENILFKNGFNFSKYDNYCTWEKSKQIYKYEKYNVENLAAEEGWYVASPHDAYCDAFALVPIFCGLKEKESMKITAINFKDKKIETCYDYDLLMFRLPEDWINLNLAKQNEYFNYIKDFIQKCEKEAAEIELRYYGEKLDDFERLQIISKVAEATITDVDLNIGYMGRPLWFHDKIDASVDVQRRMGNYKNKFNNLQIVLNENDEITRKLVK